MSRVPADHIRAPRVRLTIRVERQTGIQDRFGGTVGAYLQAIGEATALRKDHIIYLEKSPEK